jgi:hypothetical protein
VTILEAVQHHLANTAAVAALAPGGIWDGYLPAGQPLPAAVLSRVGVTRSNHQGGTSGPHMTRVQVSCLGKNGREARALAAAVVAAMETMAGPIGTPPDTINVVRAFHTSESDQFQTTDSGADGQEAHIPVEFETWHD